MPKSDPADSFALNRYSERPGPLSSQDLLDQDFDTALLYLGRLSGIIVNLAHFTSATSTHCEMQPRKHCSQDRTATTAESRQQATNTGTPIETLELADEFDRLHSTVQTVRYQFSTTLSDRLSPDKLEELQEQILLRTEEQMFSIAWRTADQSSRTEDELRSKAQILAYFVNDEPNELVSQLTRSLCNDILSPSPREPRVQ